MSYFFSLRQNMQSAAFLSYICLSVTELKIHRKERVAILTIHFWIKFNRQLIRFYQIKIRKLLNSRQFLQFWILKKNKKNKNGQSSILKLNCSGWRRRFVGTTGKGWGQLSWFETNARLTASFGHTRALGSSSHSGKATFGGKAGLVGYFRIFFLGYLKSRVKQP